jgi:hypothetical protein
MGDSRGEILIKNEVRERLHDKKNYHKNIKRPTYCREYKTKNFS